MPVLRMLLLCALCAASASCKRGSDLVAAFAESLDELERVSCECRTVDSDCDDRIGVASQCELDVVRQHEDEISDWLKCAIREARATTECARDCGKVGDGSCDFDLEDACGELPEPAGQQIEAEIDRRCLEPIDCEDGSVVEGSFCNDEVECRDGSDEAFCSDDEAGASMEPTRVPPMSVPPAVPPPPVIMPPAVMPPSVVPPPTTPEQCIELTPATPTINPSCVSCVCSVAPDLVAQCDVTCWDLIECMVELCPDTMPGTSEQTQCAVENCMDFLAGAGPATMVGPTIRNTCSAVCPPF